MCKYGHGLGRLVFCKYCDIDGRRDSIPSWKIFQEYKDVVAHGQHY